MMWFCAAALQNKMYHISKRHCFHGSHDNPERDIQYLTLQYIFALHTIRSKLKKKKSHWQWSSTAKMARMKKKVSANQFNLRENLKREGIWWQMWIILTKKKKFLTRAILAGPTQMNQVYSCVGILWRPAQCRQNLRSHLRLRTDFDIWWFSFTFLL